MIEKLITKAQMASLEGAYHKGNPYELRTDVDDIGQPWFVRSYRGGGSRVRMVDTLRKQGYLNSNKLTAKGYEALSKSAAAMKFINPADLHARWTARLKDESDAAITAEQERRERQQRRIIAEETSRRERLYKLRQLMADEGIRGYKQTVTDDELLAFAVRVHEIMEVY